jgi:hypothetical protein
LVLIAGGLVWRAGWTGNDGAVTELSARLAGLQLQVRELSQRAAQANGTAGDELAARLARLEAALAAPRTPASDPNLAARVAAAETAAKAASDTVANLVRRTEDMAANLGKITERADSTAQTGAASREAAEGAPATKADRADLDRLAARTAAMEAGLKSVTEQVSKRPSPVDPAARFAVLARAAQDAVEKGTPYGAALAALKQRGADQKVLVPLEAFAQSGVPTTAALAREFSALVPVMLAATGRSAEEGFLERLQSNAEKLVRVRPISETAGDEPSAIISRAEFKVTQGDLAGATAELDKLPAAAKAPAESWIKKVQARSAAVAAAQRLTTDALGEIAAARGAADR